MTQDYYQQGLAKAKQRDYQGAIADFDLALIANPQWAELYYRRGLAYFDLGDILAAVSDYTRALELDREHRDSYYARALARLTLKNFPGALEDVEQAIKFGRDYALAYQLKGTVCKKLAQREQAIAAYKMAANLYLAQQDAENSRRCLAQARELQPPDAHPSVSVRKETNTAPIVSTEEFYAQLLTRGEQGDIWGAITDADWAIRTNPGDARAYTCRGLLHLKRGDRQNALVDLNQAIRLDDRDRVAYRNRGKIRAQIGDYGGAIGDFDRALEIDSRDPLLYLARGQARGAMNNYLQAIEDFSLAIEIDPQAPGGYIERAQAYVKIEEIKLAIEDYQRAANLYLDRQELEQYEGVVSALKKLQISQPQSKGVNYGDRGAGDLSGLRQRLLVLVGGQWAIAERLIEQMRDRYPGYAEDWYIERVVEDLERGRS
jgi:tetratricopeptide (TPR) repeat protein